MRTAHGESRGRRIQIMAARKPTIYETVLGIDPDEILLEVVEKF
jgi:hypothetical protein